MSSGSTGRSGDTSVAGLSEAKWGVRPEPAIARYAEPGWQWSPLPLERRCPRCQGELHGLYRAHPNRGKQQLQAAVVCGACPASFTLRELQLAQKAVLGDLRPDAVARRLAEDEQLAALAQPLQRATVQPVATAHDPVSAVPPETPERQSTTRAQRATAEDDQSAAPQSQALEPAGPRRRMSTATVAARIRSILTPTGDVVSSHDAEAPSLPPALLNTAAAQVWWCKTTEQGMRLLPAALSSVDARVLLPDSVDFDTLREYLTEHGIAHRSIRHWLEQETVSSHPDDVTQLQAVASLADVGGIVPDRCDPVGGDKGWAARLAFQLIWDLHEPQDPSSVPDPVPAEHLVPAEWLPYLPFAMLNPAQTQAAPHIVDGDDHLLITAPTGAGKTTIGMLAALKAILSEGRKAAWLVPQRSLTDELDRELTVWRNQGLRVERLSGEYAVDVERVKAADLWVATTEKFEAICRAASLQAALGEVGCMVVDEIHLLGSPARGAVLEALLARVRGVESPVRIVGLSATVSNSAEVAEWLQAQLVATTWRPSRVTWQLVTIPAGSGFVASNRMREQVTIDLVARHTAEHGSVLVFCGSKRKVQSTAMAIATDRGAALHTVATDDIDAVTTLCAEVGVRMHYADYDHKHAAEKAFREREADVLVATSTVAAGVNLPARAVIVRDTQIGNQVMDTSMVLQMFGRAGRIGAGETEGWSYLIVEEQHRAAWQTRLVAGYSVYSRIHDSLPDHVLAEVLQGRITSMADAEAWWVETLAYAQGDDAMEPVHHAVDFLLQEGHLTGKPHGDTVALSITELGRLTARMMVSTEAGHRLRKALSVLPTPTDPDTAEDCLILVLCVAVAALSTIPVPDKVIPAVATVVKAGGRTSQVTHTTSVKGLGSQNTTSPGDLARAGLLLAARSPHLFASASPARRIVAGIPVSTLFPVFDQAPRFLSWLAAQGVLGTVHPWVAIVAADLDYRIRWRHLAPRRGAGRLLWLCEQMATRTRQHQLVPEMWRSAIARDVRADWQPGRPPAECELDHAGYTTLLRERASGAILTVGDEHASVTGTVAATAVSWNGKLHSPPTATRATTVVTYPTNTDDDKGIAVFTRRGDYRGSGWLSAYDAIASSDDSAAPQPRPRPARRGLGFV